MAGVNIGDSRFRTPKQGENTFLEKKDSKQRFYSQQLTAQPFISLAAAVNLGVLFTPIGNSKQILFNYFFVVIRFNDSSAGSMINVNRFTASMSLSQLNDSDIKGSNSFFFNPFQYEPNLILVTDNNFQLLINVTCTGAMVLTDTGQTPSAGDTIDIFATVGYQTI